MKNTNDIHIKKLQNKIYTCLDSLIDADYSLIDIPDYNNIGDNLIWEGELDYLSRLKYKKLFESNCWIFRDKDLPPNGIILIQGGGNFGDLYRESQDLKIHLIEKYIDRKIIIFPQSIHYNDMDFFKRDIHIIKNHPNLHICVRDKESYDLLITNGLENIYLLPDMAFCIDFSKYEINPIDNNKKLLMKRKDKELNSDDITKQVVEKNPDIEILDWPTFNISKNKHRINYRKERYNRILSKKIISNPILNKFVDKRFGLKPRNQREKYILIGINFLNQFNVNRQQKVDI